MFLILGKPIVLNQRLPPRLRAHAFGTRCLLACMCRTSLLIGCPGDLRSTNSVPLPAGVRHPVIFTGDRDDERCLLQNWHLQPEEHTLLQRSETMRQNLEPLLTPPSPGEKQSKYQVPQRSFYLLLGSSTLCSVGCGVMVITLTPLGDSKRCHIPFGTTRI